MLPLVLLPLLLPSLSLAAIAGLDPSLQHRYPHAPTFTCLSPPHKVIPYKAINDDYCDCPDGSDEPGTSACRNATFYCHNTGHLPASILSSRVNDGICDPECCDGSDEAPGVCANVCESVGAEHRAVQQAATKLRKTGSKIRSTYVAFAQKEKARLEEEIDRLVDEITGKEAEVKEAESKVGSMEADQEDVKAKRRSSPLYESLLTHRRSLAALQTRTNRVSSELEQLKGIMEDLVRSYNPNYQDMAVRAAAKGYMELFHGGQTPPAEGTGSGDPAEGEEEEEEKVWEGEISDMELSALDEVDLEGLLVGWEDGSSAGFKSIHDHSILYNLGSYIPEPFVESYEFMRGGLVYWLIKLGVVESTNIRSTAPSSPSTHASPSRDELTAAQTALSALQTALSSAKASVDSLGSKFGPEGEWKKLEGSCVEKDLGEYTYELCFFGEAKQRSNRGGSTNSLGKFKTWNYDSSAEPSTEAYYSKQLYDMGAKCWNGPHRSVKLNLRCGKENLLTNVMELEKCEYLFQGTSPALCWPDREQEQGRVEEGRPAGKEL